MKLTSAQIEEYESRGFIALPALIGAEELEQLRKDLTKVDPGEDGVIKEKSGAVRTVFRVHDLTGPTGLDSFHALSRIPRMLEPARQLLRDEQLYVYHTKCNLKAAITGEIWQWHQDFGYWANDGVQEADGMTTALVMLSEAKEISGCLYFIPGSHKRGQIPPVLDESTTSYSLWTVPQSNVIDLMGHYGDPVPIVGKPGTVVLFHPHLVHGSGHNMSRYSRWHVYVVYNRVANKPQIVEKPRSEWVVSTNHTPLTTVGDAAIIAQGMTVAS